MFQALRKHWPEYLMESAGLGIFMISAGLIATLLEYPESPVRQVVENPFIRRIPMGIAMGLTAVLVIYSPWGKRSGAHINPAVTITFFRLGKIDTWDTLFYITFQFAGGLLGIVLVSLIIGSAFGHPKVNFVVTIPGSLGISVAFFAELVIAFGLMITILFSINVSKINSYTGLFAGILVAFYIILEAPLSGMSINPARSFASALPANLWTAFWIYMVAPPLGMLLAAELYLHHRGVKKVYCAKLHHNNHQRCIFKCRYDEISKKKEKKSDH